ncbi:MAG: glycohydrolase toxin TNT-related protein [Candidatus Saccharimonadales bacterium]
MYNYFRDYDPATGRYIESDPTGLNGGPNTYAYVGGNPLAEFDRFGLAGGAEEEEEVEEQPLKQLLVQADMRNLIQQIQEIDPEFSLMRDPSKPLSENDVRYLEDYLKALRNQHLCSTGGQSPDWPPNNGFLLYPTAETLNAGDEIDRYGREGGEYAAPVGTSFSSRSLPKQGPYARYEVVKPFTVQSGPASPWFGQSGMGTQYLLPASVESLVEQGYLRRTYP